MGYTVTIGVDSSTKNCGVAVFINGGLKETFNYEFSGTYDINKLGLIIQRFEKLFSDYGPVMVLIEEPAPVRNSRAITGLNQVAGAIVATAMLRGAEVDFVHNSTVKRMYNVRSKEDSLAAAKRYFNYDCKTDHESDAILVVGAYIRLYVHE